MQHVLAAVNALEFMPRLREHMTIGHISSEVNVTADLPSRGRLAELLPPRPFAPPLVPPLPPPLPPFWAPLSFPSPASTAAFALPPPLAAPPRAFPPPLAPRPPPAAQLAHHLA